MRFLSIAYPESYVDAKGQPSVSKFQINANVIKGRAPPVRQLYDLALQQQLAFQNIANAVDLQHAQNSLFDPAKQLSGGYQRDPLSFFGGAFNALNRRTP